MCQAVQEMCDDARAEGRTQGYRGRKYWASETGAAYRTENAQRQQIYTGRYL